MPGVLSVLGQRILVRRGIRIHTNPTDTSDAPHLMAMLRYIHCVTAAQSRAPPSKSESTDRNAPSDR